MKKTLAILLLALGFSSVAMAGEAKMDYDYLADTQYQLDSGC